MDADRSARAWLTRTPIAVACRVNGDDGRARRPSDGAAARRAAQRPAASPARRKAAAKASAAPARCWSTASSSTAASMPLAQADGRGDHDDRRRGAAAIGSTPCRRRSSSTAARSAASARRGWCSPRSTLLERNPDPTEADVRHGARRQPVPLHRLHAHLRGRRCRPHSARRASVDEIVPAGLRSRECRRRSSEALTLLAEPEAGGARSPAAPT